ncbi:mitochondrial ribosome assembly protein RRG9 NDAI_0F03660 [Naumovozyma dairenensis CBS 421]|uniref:Required for respiratory growth protein 9, mitochondrial n=1 Tax=Naumovozyma dairenensis (strain ATCC 10597 / BCRC 20456 / CBS 421 / NBRC 0211 / NRRL Y-12639) TaxID=1071378 RepID=G0WD23_NAUDC|nr:hypothetical protein NDAI_0F03660 [Naumovozyma dairenensis CBS 421]CCD25684.1 hypothetical protein NDAI_0F03660 [Naumovozyma dairenensis CBS 421]
MNVLLKLCRSFSQASYNVTLLKESKGKIISGKKIIKWVNDSSLSKKEMGKIDKEKMDTWKRQNIALKEKFKGERWAPKKKLSRTEMGSVRLLREQFPDMTASELGEKFKVSPEAIRRILKSNWKPSEDEDRRIAQRWKKRGEKIKYLYGSTRLGDERVSASTVDPGKK